MNDTKCKHCGGDIAVRNPSGYCDHLYYPENCNVCRHQKDSTSKRVENVAGEIWRICKKELEERGIKFPPNWDSIGASYGSYARIGALIKQTIATAIREREEEILAAPDELQKKEDPYDSRGDIYWGEFHRALDLFRSLIRPNN